MSNDFKKNIEEIKNIFKDKEDPESKYLTIIKMGKKMASLNPTSKVAINKVEGCQSTTYICSSYQNGLLNYQAESDALISSGLAALLIFVYNNQPPEIIINNPPEFVHELGIHASLSPNRANGLLQIYQKMKQDALNFLNKA